MKHATVLVMMSVACSLATTGCIAGTVVSEGVGTVRGAKGIYVPLTTQPVAVMVAYTRFELGAFGDDFAGKTPQELLRELPRYFQEELDKRKISSAHLPAGKTLIVRGTALHYEDVKFVGMVIGPLEEVLVRAELVDKASGTVLATANCVGRSTTRINSGVSHKAEGLAKALVSWIAKSREPKKKDD